MAMNREILIPVVDLALAIFVGGGVALSQLPDSGSEENSTPQ